MNLDTMQDRIEHIFIRCSIVSILILCKRAESYKRLYLI